MSEQTFDFGVGRSDPDTFPVAALQAAACKVLEEQRVALSHYPGGLGHAGLRQAMAKREGDREGIAINPDHIALTNGSMQAVTLCAQALTSGPGDVIVAEEFTYSGTIGAYKSLGFEFAGIPVDEDGMRMDALSDTLAALAAHNRKPAFIYTLTNYQNPTGTVMPETRRRELIRLAQKYDLVVVEDNCYGDVHYEGKVPPALFAMDDDPRHIYLGSLSKILAPGLRLGYLYAKPPMLQKLLALRNDAGSNTFAAAVAAEFYQNGITAHSAVTTPPLREKRDVLLASLKNELTDICAWSEPIGGLFLWLRFPDDINSEDLLKKCAEKKVFYIPGSAFHVDGKDVPYLRLAFGHLDLETIQLGVTKLAQCIRETRTSNEKKSFANLYD